MRTPRPPSPADELRATMLVENVTARPDKPDPLGAIGAVELIFALGAVLFVTGLWLVWPPLAFVTGGISLAALAWQSA